MDKKEQTHYYLIGGEIMMAVKMLICTMEEADIQNFIKFDYELNNQKYNLMFTKNVSK